jgi:hypothetical protein
VIARGAAERVGDDRIEVGRLGLLGGVHLAARC